MDMECIELGRKEQLSYLRARDPSILTFTRFSTLKRLKLNFATEALQEESIAEQEASKEPTLRNIQIYLRVKNVKSLGDLYELNGNTIHCLAPEGSHSNRNIKHGQYLKRTYTFSHIFGPTATQEEVFNHTVKPKLLELINGENSSLMTYGASGAGKTFTIVGTAEDPGVIPRALEYLFGSLPQLSVAPRVKPTPTGAVIVLTGMLSALEKNARDTLLSNLNATVDKQHIRTYQAMQERLSSEPVAEVEEFKDVSIAVWVSFAEIYNEQVYDLLAPEPLKGKSRTKLHLGKSDAKMYIKNLTNISVSNGLEAFQILQYGLHNLKYAATAINTHSSRSHCIFTIKLVQAIENKDGDCYHVSYFNFCDLAGSERMKKTLNAGDRLKESKNINTSLMVLGRCISLIRDAQFKNDNAKLIPYRDSKLTMLFQTALSGKEDIAMIVNINPCLQMFDETSHVLNFSAIAKQIAIRNKEKQPLKPVKQGETETNSLLEEENAKLREIIICLHNDREQEKMQMEENLTQAVADYHKLMQSFEDKWRNKLRLAEERSEEEKQRAINDIKGQYESMEENEPKRFKGVIVLDSDDEEDELECQCSELNIKVNTLQAEVTKLKFDKQILETGLSKLRQENVDFQEQIKQTVMCQSNGSKCMNNGDDRRELECLCSDLNIKVNALQAELTESEFEKQTLEEQIGKIEQEKIGLQQQITQAYVLLNNDSTLEMG